jgi:hypothetical protein
MQQVKVLTVRLSPDEARYAELAARIDGISCNEVFRRALHEYFELKRADADFMDRARVMIAEDADIVAGLR